MPKAVKFKANSVVYFKGDIQDTIYLMQSGAVVSKFNDIVTSVEINELIKTGEFFGVKSALGKFPREETAMVVRDSLLLSFTSREFEIFVSSNTRIIMKMLKVFSKQLRVIHNRVQNLLAKNSQEEPEQGLFRIGEYYYKQNKCRKAHYAFNRYLTFYPSGQFCDDASRYIKEIETSGSIEKTPPKQAPSVDEKNPVSEKYYELQQAVQSEDYNKAYVLIQDLLSLGETEYYITVRYLEIKVLYFSNKFEECIEKAKAFIQEYPKYPKVPDILYHIGLCYMEKEDPAKSITFFNKVLTLTTDETLKQLVQKNLQKMRG